MQAFQPKETGLTGKHWGDWGKNDTISGITRDVALEVLVTASDVILINELMF